MGSIMSKHTTSAQRIKGILAHKEVNWQTPVAATFGSRMHQQKASWLISKAWKAGVFCLLSIAECCLINISVDSERTNRGLCVAPSLARSSHVSRKTVCRFQIEQIQEDTLPGRSKTSILQIKPQKTYSHKRNLKRSRPKTRLSKTDAYTQPLKIHLASNFINISGFSAKPYYFPSSCYNCFICLFTQFWSPLTYALYFCVDGMESFPRFFSLFSASIFFPLGSFFLVSL